MPISVDFPAPFGPSRPTISPRRARQRDRATTARRRPKCARDVDRARRDRNRGRRSSGQACAVAPGSRAGVVGVERAVDVLERGDQLLASRGIRGVADACRARWSLSRRTRSWNSFSRRAISRLPLGDTLRRLLRPRCRPRPGDDDQPGERQRDAARRAGCDAAGRRASTRSAGRPAPHRRPPRCSVSPSRGHVLLPLNLRRRELHALRPS